MSEEVKTVEERIAYLEKQNEWLVAGYKDLAYEFTDSLAKRIEAIRDEVMASLNSTESRIFALAFLRISEAVASARDQISLDAITNGVLPKLTDGSHVLVTRPASREEQRSGQAIPVQQRR